jgi:hypothetical protein
MTSNPILAEIHAAREKLLEAYQGDLHAYVEDARQRALKSGHPIAQPSSRASNVSDERSATTDTPTPIARDS